MRQSDIQHIEDAPLRKMRGFGARHHTLKTGLENCPSLRDLIWLLETSSDVLSSRPLINMMLDQFTNSDEIVTLLEQEFQRIMFEMVPPPPGNSFIIYRGKDYSLTCDFNMTLTKRKLLTTLPCGALMRVLRSDGPISFFHYRLPKAVDMSILDPHAKLELLEHHKLSRQSPRASFQSNDVIELVGSGSMVSITLREHAMSPFTWAFDSENLKPLFITVSDQSYNRWKTLIELIVRFHGTEYESIFSNDLLTRLGDHELHYLRWSACQALAKIDLAAAKELIVKLTHDPHTHVRRAATAALKRMQQLETTAKR